MYDPDKMLIYRRDGFPNGIDRVVDSYEFKPDARNGQIRKVVVIYQPGRGYCCAHRRQEVSGTRLSKRPMGISQG